MPLVEELSQDGGERLGAGRRKEEVGGSRWARIGRFWLVIFVGVGRNFCWFHWVFLGVSEGVRYYFLVSWVSGFPQTSKKEVFFELVE